MRKAIRTHSLLAVLMTAAFMLAGCADDGAQGPPGAPGAQGVPGTQGPPGAPGADATDVPLEAAGVVGVVTDRAGAKLAGGTVYFVPAADVAALPATTIAADSTNDEPLEDTIAAGSATYQQAAVGSDGRYALPTLASGSYFVTYVPATADSGHLPGGSLCRIALASTELVGTRRDLQVSSAPPADATYVGSGRCVSCHGRLATGKTMHRLGIWSPYEAGPLQNQDDRVGELWKALAEKFDTPATVYFYGYDAARGFDKYKTAETDPGAGVSFTVTTRKTGSDYEMLLHNVANPADPDRVIRLDAVYGGGVHKQRYLTKLAVPNGFFYVTMPLQYQPEGGEGASFGRTSKTWRDYHGDWFYNETSKTFKTPVPKNSFEKNCISCHANGTQITGSDATNWEASTITDQYWGDFDYDGDGLAEEMNMGCETCHGPGSAHWDSAGLGRQIVSPSLLTPERESMICGQCHSRPKGALGTDSPVDAEGKMLTAGSSRSDFLANHATTQLDGAASDFYADEHKHSKSHHQQYSDFIRSALYKNDRQLLSCSNCHELHGTPHTRQLKADPTDNAASCGGCHATEIGDLSGHLQAKIAVTPGIADFKANNGILCADCHMPKAAKTGAGTPGLLAGGTQYWQNDVTAHLFKMPDKIWSQTTGQNMPTGYTKACGNACHTAIAPPGA